MHVFRSGFTWLQLCAALMAVQCRATCRDKCAPLIDACKANEIPREKCKAMVGECVEACHACQQGCVDEHMACTATKDECKKAHHNCNAECSKPPQP